MRKWRIEDSEELYNITGWGTSYFSINDKGHVVVTPRKNGVAVDLKELVDELQVTGCRSTLLPWFVSRIFLIIVSKKNFELFQASI